MIKVAITGSTGLIGTRIIELLENDFDFIPILQSEIDITNKDDVKKKLESIDFDILLHMAAYTNVDNAEKEKELAYSINVNGTKNIFEIVQNKNKKLIYISTDFVFDGKTSPYDENSKPKPVSYYGQTKLEGEKIVNNNAMIVRFSYPYRAVFDQKKDLVRGIKAMLEEKKPLQMVTDSVITPTFIDDIALSFKHLFNNYSPSTYHIVGADSLSPFETGKLVAKYFRLDESLIKPITCAVYFKNKAKRPQYSEIKSINNNFYKMRSFEEGLTEVVKQLRNF
ncbi:MAG: NAD(P)-dependent oxidoreductase [bacterium]|nr:NAD(P)-dependent oxidoreductase [bacterium]